MSKSFAVLVSIFMLFISPTILLAAERSADTKKTTWNDIFSGVIGNYPITNALAGDDSVGKSSKLSIPKNWEFDIGMKRFVLSHTSYEFGSPEGAFTKPLSRLEFPVNTWWLNLDLRRTSPRWSIGGRAGLSLNRNSNWWMEDTDWGTTGSANYVTNYSRSYCDIRQAFLFRGDVDVNVSDWLRLPSSWEVRPLFAFQFQRFKAMAHDGIQSDYDPGTTFTLDGDSISFRQDWYTYMFGLRGSYSLKLNKNMTVKLKGEADFGPAFGYNEDHHLLRGERRTYEKTSGSAFYFLTGMDMIVAKTITMGVGIDYLGIRTSGTHRWWDPAEGADQSWSDGVYAWSDQLGFSAHVSYAF